MMGRDGSTRGQAKIQQLKDNANYMRKRLTAMGCRVLGDYDSPVLVGPVHTSLKYGAPSKLLLDSQQVSNTAPASLRAKS